MSRPSGLRLALAGGGTGGHLVPGLHLLAEARAGGEDALESVVWFTSGRAVEERVLAGLEDLARAWEPRRVVLDLEPRGGGAPALGGLAARLPRAVRTARGALLASRAEVLLGLGGFTSLAPALAARSLGLPVALLEVNAVAGRATRWLSPLAARVFHALPASAGRGARHVHTGPPLPPELARAEAPDREPEPALLLVLGGSQGARALNRFVAEHVGSWTARGARVVHQVGPGKRDEAGAPRSGYEVHEYLGDVPRLLRAATWVLCRGGASTLAEVGAARVPAWVVPYPHHKDGHQRENARALGAGAVVVEEGALDAELARSIGERLGPAGARERAERRAALDRAVPRDGARRILTELTRLARGER